MLGNLRSPGKWIKWRPLALVHIRALRAKPSYTVWVSVQPLPFASTTWSQTHLTWAWVSVTGQVTALLGGSHEH